MRWCCFTHGKKRLYAAVFFEDEDEDVGFLSSFERERERERENNNNNNNNNKTRYRYHQYHAFVKVYITRVVPFPCRGRTETV